MHPLLVFQHKVYIAKSGPNEVAHHQLARIRIQIYTMNVYICILKMKYSEFCAHRIAIERDSRFMGGGLGDDGG